MSENVQEQNSEEITKEPTFEELLEEVKKEETEQKEKAKKELLKAMVAVIYKIETALGEQDSIEFSEANDHLAINVEKFKDNEKFQEFLKKRGLSVSVSLPSKTEDEDTMNVLIEKTTSEKAAD